MLDLFLIRRSYQIKKCTSYNPFLPNRKLHLQLNLHLWLNRLIKIDNKVVITPNRITTTTATAFTPTFRGFRVFFGAPPGISAGTSIMAYFMAVAALQ